MFDIWIVNQLNLLYFNISKVGIIVTKSMVVLAIGYIKEWKMTV